MDKKITLPDTLLRVRIAKFKFTFPEGDYYDKACTHSSRTKFMES